ncbi:lamin tail domain-containing protein [Patescibacteria group bacterium]
MPRFLFVSKTVSKIIAVIFAIAIIGGVFWFLGQTQGSRMNPLAGIEGAFQELINQYFDPQTQTIEVFSDEEELFEEEFSQLDKEDEREKEKEETEATASQGDNRSETDKIIEIIDDISERIDILNQEVRELAGFDDLQSEKEAEDELGEENPEQEEDEEEEDDDDDEEEEESEEEEEFVSKEVFFCPENQESFPARNRVIFNEISWMGSQNSANDEWIELKNISGSEINLAGWQIIDKDQKIKIIFGNEHIVPAGGFFLLERTDDATVPDILADFIFKGAMNDTNEILYLFNESCQLQGKVSAVPDWPAGNKSEKRSMERGTDFNWHTFSGLGQYGILGTPKKENSQPINHSEGGGNQSSAFFKILITEIQTEGQTAKDEFIELYNPNSQNVDLSGFSLKKKTSGGNESNLVSSVKFSGNIVSNGYFLVVPQPNNDGTLNYKGSAAPDFYYSGKTYSIAKNNTVLLYNSAGNLIDKVGFGEAKDFETFSASNPEKDQSLGRKWDPGVREYQDTNNNAEDFEIQEPTPKAKNKNSVSPFFSDITPPTVVFGPIASVQTSPYFSIPWSGQDVTPSDTDGISFVTPSGIDGFFIQYSVVTPSMDGTALFYQQEGAWREWLINEIKKISADVQEFNLLGRDGYSYNFKIKAEDKAGNESEWAEVFTKINLSSKVLINEVQIDSLSGDGGTKDDWVELYNPNNYPVDISQWSIQRQASSGIIYKKNFESGHLISPKGYFLIVRNDANDNLLDLADMSCSMLQLSDNQTIYLAKNQKLVDNSGDVDIIDKVGFGFEPSSSESAPAITPPEEKSIERKELGLDADNNSQDFAINNNPSPTNSKNETL